MIRYGYKKGFVLSGIEPERHPHGVSQDEQSRTDVRSVLSPHKGPGVIHGPCSHILGRASRYT